MPEDPADDGARPEGSGALAPSGEAVIPEHPADDGARPASDHDPATGEALAAEAREKAGANATLRAMMGEDFSLNDVIGGWRGLAESLAPGLVFVVVYVATRNLAASLISSLAIALLAVVIRLLGRSPVTQALSGIGGVVVGVIWAALTQRAQDYFAGGFVTNVAILVVALGSILARRPAIGVIYGLLGEHPGWRADRAIRRRATWATWLWVALPALRLIVQWPLYLDGAAAVGWLGTARLVMGLPLTALCAWLSWLLLRRPKAA